MERHFMAAHSMSFEVYNFSINEWVDASIMPTESVIVEGQNLDVRGVHLSHMSGIRLKGKKMPMSFLP